MPIQILLTKLLKAASSVQTLRRFMFHSRVGTIYKANLQEGSKQTQALTMSEENRLTTRPIWRNKKQHKTFYKAS